MRTKYIVKFSKYFTSGNLQGLMVDCQLSFPNLDLATQYVGWTIKHSNKPVKSIFDSCDFTTHVGRIEVEL